VLAIPEIIGDLLGLFEQGHYSKKIFNNLPARNIIVTLFRQYDKTNRGFHDYSELMKPLTDAEKGEFRDIFDSAKRVVPNRDELEDNVLSSLNAFQEMYDKNKLRKLDQDIKIAERQNDVASVQALIKEKFAGIQNKRHKKQTGAENSNNERSPRDINENVNNNGFLKTNQIQTST